MTVTSLHMQKLNCAGPTYVYVLRVYKKERYIQIEIVYLFYSIVLPNLAHGFSIFSWCLRHGFSVFQQFLDRCACYK